jgi:hypothetical protein
MPVARTTMLHERGLAILVVVLLAASVLPLRSSMVAGAPDPPQPASNPWRDPMRELLVLPCGSCHRSSLATAKPRALAVFDLDETVWDRHMTDDQVREMARRARASKEIDALDRPTVDRFESCRLQALCEPGASAP